MAKLTIKVEDIASVYSGRLGACCCGCAGIHRYAAKHRVSAGKRRGYEVSDDEINDKQVRKVVKLIEAADEVEVARSYVHADVAGRTYIAYFAEV